MNEVLETETFSKLVEVCDGTELQWIEKMKDQLAQNLLVGKPLKFNWFREKKLGNKRLYYIISETKRRAVLIAYGPKKEQQKIIDKIIADKERYLRLLD